MLFSLSPPSNEREESTALTRPTSNGVYPSINKPADSPSDEYVNLIMPTRPAPQVPAQQPTNNYVPSTYGTLSNYQG